MAFCFIHAADLHLDTPFEGVAGMSVAVAERLRDASLEAFDGMVRLAIDRRAAFVLLAGDLYDGAERGVRAQLRFLRGLGVLSAAGIPVFIVHGNHDPVGGWPGVREWPPGVTVFGSEQVEVVPVTRDGVVLARVYGISYGHREVTENLALRFRREEGPGLHIGLLHCNVGDDPAHGRYSPCALSDLERAGMDYWALGHVHKRQILREGGPWVVYPGNTQGRSPKPSERGAKGACVVLVEGGEIRSVEHVDLDRVRFVALEVDVAGVADLGALRARLAAEVDALTAVQRWSRPAGAVHVAGPRSGPRRPSLPRGSRRASARPARRDLRGAVSGGRACATSPGRRSTWRRYVAEGTSPPNCCSSGSARGRRGRVDALRGDRAAWGRPLWSPPPPGLCRRG